MFETDVEEEGVLSGEGKLAGETGQVGVEASQVT